jgi:hypothetical protein
MSFFSRLLGSDRATETYRRYVMDKGGEWINVTSLEDGCFSYMNSRTGETMKCSPNERVVFIDPEKQGDQ